MLESEVYAIDMEPISPDDGPWWSDPDHREDLEGALSHVNAARSIARSDPEDYLGISGWTFRALNRLMSAFWRDAVSSGDEPTAGAKALRKMLARLSSVEREWIANRESLQELACFEPYIQAHSTIRRLEAGEPTPRGQSDDPEFEHKTFHRRYNRWRERPNSDHRTRSLEALADLVWMVRSNSFHGEKTSRSHDLRQVQRDQQVAALVLPVVEDLVDVLLDRPSRCLAVYGSLVSGEFNDYVVRVDGTRVKGHVQGRLDDWNGYRRLHWLKQYPNQLVEVAESEDLEANWARLDRFEGNAYMRGLVPVSLVGGRTIVASCYLAGD